MGVKKFGKHHKRRDSNVPITAMLMSEEDLFDYSDKMHKDDTDYEDYEEETHILEQMPACI